MAWHGIGWDGIYDDDGMAWDGHQRGRGMEQNSFKITFFSIFNQTFHKISSFFFLLQDINLFFYFSTIIVLNSVILAFMFDYFCP